MSAPTWYTFPDYLSEVFPELASEIEASYLSWAEAVANPFPHFFIEEFLIPLLVGTGPITALERRRDAGRVLDELLQSNDDDLAAAAQTSVIEMLRDEPALRADAWPVLGPVAREWLTQLTTDSSIPR